MNFTAISGKRENISGERESRNDKGFTALPKDIPFSRREDETLEREMRRKKGEMGP